ncbi:MAG: hypothetical protein JJ959_19740 [Nisaea sp.]|uniref:hypothetical protein n=1 Tax=Nisaea sp. TaxID=2024842 RepID=UPI001B1461E1|nr:hypothetical protein [Nisaea sp.]MBO6562791.1 hypothetical protein [Nisaea sp.]
MQIAARTVASQSEMRQRLSWVDRLVDRESDGDGLDLAPQAAALFDEMRLCFASGAWVAVLVLAQAALDAELQQEGLDGLAQNEIRFGADYVWLRNRRNHLLHADDPRPAVTLEDYAPGDPHLEREARRAVELVVGGLAELAR